jgi:hypothetical protein
MLAFLCHLGVWGISKLGVLEKGLMRELYELRLRCHDHEDLRGFPCDGGWGRFSLYMLDLYFSL